LSDQRKWDPLFWALVGILVVPVVIFSGFVLAALVSRVIPVKAGFWWGFYLSFYRLCYLLALGGTAAVLYCKTGLKSFGFWLIVLALPLAILSPPVQAMADIRSVVFSFPAAALALAALAVTTEISMVGWGRWLVLMGAFPLMVWELFQFAALRVAPQALASFWQQSILLTFIVRYGGVLSYLLVALAAIFVYLEKKARQKFTGGPGRLTLVFYLSTVIIVTVGLFFCLLQATPRSYARYTLEIAPQKKVSGLVIQFPLPLKEEKVLAGFLRRTRLLGKESEQGQLSIVLTPYGRMGQLKVHELTQPLKIFWDEKLSLGWLAGNNPVPLALQPRFAGEWWQRLPDLDSTKMLDYAGVVTLPLYTAFTGKNVNIDLRFELNVPGIRGSNYRQIFCQYVPLEYAAGFTVAGDGWKLLPVMEEVLVDDEGGGRR